MTALCSGKICTIFPEKGALNFWKACTIALEYSMFPEVPSITEFKGNATIGKYQCILTDSIKHRILDILPQRTQGYLTSITNIK